MASIEILAGDWKKQKVSYTLGSLTFQPPPGKWMPEVVHQGELEEVAIATEETVKKLGGTIGWGAAGALILGPVGLLAGLLLGGKKKEVTFIAKFRDGRKFMATTDSGTFTKLQAVVFK